MRSRAPSQPSRPALCLRHECRAPPWAVSGPIVAAASGAVGLRRSTAYDRRERAALLSTLWSIPSPQAERLPVTARAHRDRSRGRRITASRSSTGDRRCQAERHRGCQPGVAQRSPLRTGTAWILPSLSSPSLVSARPGSTCIRHTGSETRPATILNRSHRTRSATSRSRSSWLTMTIERRTWPEGPASWRRGFSPVRRVRVFVVRGARG